MSQENVEFIEGLIKGADAMDKQAVLAALPELISQTCAPDIEWAEDPRRADGTIYNFGSGAWEVLPGSGVPTAQQVRALTRYAASCPLANQRYAAVPAPVFLYSGTWLATFQLNGDGTIASQADDCPHIPGLSDSGVLSVLSATPVGPITSAAGSVRSPKPEPIIVVASIQGRPCPCSGTARSIRTTVP